MPEPNPQDWATWAHVQSVLGVSRQTVIRMVAEGLLTQYRIAGGHPVFWLSEVQELREARERCGRGRVKANA